MNTDEYLKLIVVSIIFFGFISLAIQTLVSVFFISYGDCKYITSLDSVFSKRKNLSMVWSKRAARGYWYGFKYPFFCIFNRSQKIGFKMHVFMFINSYATWFWILASIWVFCFK